jgi:hypothetical protein
MRNSSSNYTWFVPTIVIGVWLSALGPVLHAQTAPSTYSAYTGTDTKAIPPAPSLGPANSVFTDPTFGSQILRVTDPNTNGGESFVSTDAGFHRAWNADSTAIKLTGPHGDGYWLEFNANTFMVGDGSSKPVIHYMRLGATWEWSALDPDIIYFLHGNQIAEYNKATGVITDLGGPPNGDAVTYMAVVVGQDNWVCSAAGSGSQNSYTEIFCLNPINPSVSEFIDVLNKTINGVVSSDPNWPTSASGQTIGIHDISGGTGASWLEVTFHRNSWGANGGAVFDLATNTWSEVTNGDFYWGGHVSMGNGKYVNSSGSINGNDSRGMVVRDPDNLMNSAEYLFIEQPPNTLNKWCDADHNSWLNSMTNPNAPILISRYTLVIPCQYTWSAEIDAAAVDGSNTVWRFAHNHNGGNVCYYAESFAQISNDGRWALFSSYWDGKLGSDTSFGCSTRIDTFIVDLFSAGDPPPTGNGGGGPPVTPLAITTTTLPDTTQGVAYSATLTATGGLSPYTWSVTSGSLPAGLSLSSSGTISGTASTYGTSTFTVQALSSDSQTASVTLSLTVNPPPITLVQSQMIEGSGLSSISLGFSSSNQAGNLIIAFVRMSTNWETVTVTDSAGNVYADAVSQGQTVEGHQVHLFYAKNIAGAAANTVTALFSGTNNHPFLAIYEYSGLNTTNPLDKTAQAEGSSSVANSGMTAVTSSANELVFAAAGLPASYTGTATAGTGYAMLQQDTGTSRAANEVATASSTASFAAIFGLNPSTDWTAILATFYSVGSGPAVPPLAITTTTLPDTTQGVAYSATLTATGGLSPYTWSVTSGSLQAGLSLSSSGTISGTASTYGTSTFTVQALSSDSQTASVTLSMTVNPPPITLVQSQMIEGSGLSSISVGFSSSNQAGNLIIAFVRMSTNWETVTVTDSAGNVYADAVSQGQTVDGHQVHLFYAKNIAGAAANTVSALFSGTNNHPFLAIYEYSGLNTANPLDKTAQGQGSSSVANSGMTAVTSNANELVFAAAGLPASYTGTATAGTGYAMLQQDTGASRAANEVATASSTASFAAIFGLSPSTNWSAIVATFKQ